MIEDILNPQY